MNGSFPWRALGTVLAADLRMHLLEDAAAG